MVLTLVAARRQPSGLSTKDHGEEPGGWRRSVFAWRKFGVLLWGVAACAGCSGNPFPQVPVFGSVTYEDGSLIPAQRLQLWFESQAPPASPTTYPRPANALVDVTRGTFEAATTYKYQDGLVKGRHKVVLDIDDPRLVPAEYQNAASTPLIVDTADVPWEIRIPKPAS